MDATAPTSLLTLPYELRQDILQRVLKQKGILELQQPAWTGCQVFLQPLFRVCRSLRDEAIAAFYECNSFLCILDTEDKLCSDSLTCLAPPAMHKEGIRNPLTPVLPGNYPGLLKHLRHLHLNIYLPKIRAAWALEERLAALVRGLEGGRRLVGCHVLITTRRPNAQIPLGVGERRALEVLAEMTIPGVVHVRTHSNFRAVSEGVKGLDLERRMRRRA